MGMPKMKLSPPFLHRIKESSTGIFSPIIGQKNRRHDSCRISELSKFFRLRQ
jgi:hypothetical protein